MLSPPTKGGWMGVKASCAMLLCPLAAGVAAEGRRLESTDWLKLRSVATVRLSPDASRIAYSVEARDRPGRPYKQLWLMTVADGKSARVGGETDAGDDPAWSPDGRHLAFNGTLSGRKGLWVVAPDGSEPRFLAEVVGTNSPLTFEGAAIAWSPDSRRIAFVSATPGPEAEAASGDPVVITRYKYKPDAREGLTRFGDNRRRHIFLVDLADGV